MMIDIEILDKESIISKSPYPHKTNKVTQLLVLKGEVSFIIDFNAYNVNAPAMIIFLPDQVIESIEASSDSDMIGMAFAPELTDSLNLPISLQEKLSLKSTHFYSLNKEALEAFVSCYNQVSNLMMQRDNPYKEEIIRHLFIAHYYGLGYYTHNAQRQTSVMTGQQEICERFISLAAEYFKEHREISFYADKLCITKKYLSALLKQETGLTALEWIEKYVVLYAKSCLSSTTMTIQEISDDLDFSSQSVFGKYFKRIEGMSPIAYRQSLSKKC